MKFLKLIEQGEVKVAFRKWTRPSVRESGTLLTAVGQLRIKSVEQIGYDQITDLEIANAGYESREELDKELALKQEGNIYRISFVLGQSDPRIALRNQTSISAEEMQDLLKKLKRLDSAGSVKGWTYPTLKALAKNPGRFAVEYATELGYEKQWFKVNVRKLKNLGLTISLTNGYEISPRGKVVLENLTKSYS